MDSIVGPVLGCSILVIVLRVLWLVFYDSYFFFEPWFWLMLWINWLLLLGSHYCVIRKFDDSGSYLYRWCYDDLWWAAWVVVAVWAEGAFVDLIWMGCIHWHLEDAGVSCFLLDGELEIFFLLYSFFHFSLTTFDWNCTTEKMTIWWEEIMISSHRFYVINYDVATWTFAFWGQFMEGYQKNLSGLQVRDSDSRTPL